jgi:methionyl-tRNA formyltransferase
MMMTETLDAGDILLQERIGIEGNDTAGSLSARLSDIGVDLLIRTLDGLDQGEIVPQSQDHGKATYAPLLKKEDGLIDWGDSSENLRNKIRGFDPWPGTYTCYKGDRWGIWKAEITGRDASSRTPGEIVEVRPDGIVIATGDSALRVEEIQMEGKRRMGVHEYLRGHRVECGIILGPVSR